MSIKGLSTLVLNSLFFSHTCTYFVSLEYTSLTVKSWNSYFVLLLFLSLLVCISLAFYFVSFLFCSCLHLVCILVAFLFASCCVLVCFLVCVLVFVLVFILILVLVSFRFCVKKNLFEFCFKFCLGTIWLTGRILGV